MNNLFVIRTKLYYILKTLFTDETYESKSIRLIIRLEKSQLTFRTYIHKAAAPVNFTESQRQVLLQTFSSAIDASLRRLVLRHKPV